MDQYTALLKKQEELVNDIQEINQNIQVARNEKAAAAQAITEARAKQAVAIQGIAIADKKIEAAQAKQAAATQGITEAKAKQAAATQGITEARAKQAAANLQIETGLIAIVDFFEKKKASLSKIKMTDAARTQLSQEIYQVLEVFQDLKTKMQQGINVIEDYKKHSLAGKALRTKILDLEKAAQ